VELVRVTAPPVAAAARVHLETEAQAARLQQPGLRATAPQAQRTPAREEAPAAAETRPQMPVATVERVARARRDSSS
jgi:hypothetical protein